MNVGSDLLPGTRQRREAGGVYPEILLSKGVREEKGRPSTVQDVRWVFRGRLEKALCPSCPTCIALVQPAAGHISFFRPSVNWKT